MAFQSPLLPLQRLRTSLERIAWLRLRAIHTQISRQNARLRELRKEKQHLRELTLAALSEGLSSEELRISSVAALEDEAQSIHDIIERLAGQRVEAEREFMKWRRERQIVENAIAHEREEYGAEQARREQAATDDAVLQRMVRNRRETAKM